VLISGILLLILCALSFSGLDICRKKLSEKYSAFRILTLVMGAQIPLYALWYNFTTDNVIDFRSYAVWGVSDIFLNLSANILIVMSLRLSPLSNAIPLLALTPTFALLFQPLFDIPLSSSQILGAIIIFVGATILNGLPRWKSKKDRGLFYMFCAAFCCGLLILFDRQSLQFASIPFHGLVQTVGMTTLSLIAERVFKIPQHEMDMSLKDAPWKLWMGASLFAFLAGISQLGSLKFFDPGIVEAAKRALILFLSITFGFAIFNEPLTTRKILGVLFMALGIILTSRH
jgi:drug/metabolite transporter (DMT)-like permease